MARKVPPDDSILTPEEALRKLRAMREGMPGLVEPPPGAIEPSLRSEPMPTEFLNAVIETLELIEAKKNALQREILEADGEGENV